MNIAVSRLRRPSTLFIAVAELARRFFAGRFFLASSAQGTIAHASHASALVKVLGTLLCTLIVLPSHFAHAQAPAQSTYLQIYGPAPNFPPPPLDRTGRDRIVLTPANPKVGEPFYVQLAGPFFVDRCLGKLEIDIRNESELDVGCGSFALPPGVALPTPVAVVLAPRVIDVAYYQAGERSNIGFQLIVGDVTPAVPATSTFSLALMVLAVLAASFLLMRNKRLLQSWLPSLSAVSVVSVVSGLSLFASVDAVAQASPPPGCGVAEPLVRVDAPDQDLVSV